MAENTMRFIVEGSGSGGSKGGGDKEDKNMTSVGDLTKAVTGGLAAGGVGAAILLMADIILKLFPVFEIIGGAMEDVNNSIGVLVKMMALILKPFINLFIPIFMLLAITLMPWVKLMNLLLTPVLIFFLSFLKGMAPNMMASMDTIIKTLVNMGMWLAELVTAVMSGDWDKVWGLISGAAEEIWDGIIGGIEAAIPYIKTALEGIWDGIKDITIGDLTIEEWVEDIKTTLQGAWDFMTGLFSTEEGEENPLLTFIKDPLNAVIAYVMDTFIPNAGKVFTAFSDLLVDIFDFLWNKLLQNTASSLRELIGFVLQAAVAAAKIWNQVMKEAGGPTIDTSLLKTSAGAAMTVLGVHEAGFANKAANAQDRITKFEININGDVSGDNIEKKIQEAVEKADNARLGQLGVYTP